jgi:hypothetical protein
MCREGKPYALLVVELACPNLRRWLTNGERLANYAFPRFDGLKMGSTIPFVYLHCLAWLQRANSFSWLRVTVLVLKLRSYVFVEEI